MTRLSLSLAALVLAACTQPVTLETGPCAYRADTAQECPAYGDSVAVCEANHRPSQDEQTCWQGASENTYCCREKSPPTAVCNISQLSPSICADPSQKVVVCTHAEQGSALGCEAPIVDQGTERGKVWCCF